MLEGKRVFVEIPVHDDEDTSAVIVTPTGQLPSALFLEHHKTLEDPVKDIGVHATGRVVTVDRRIPTDNGNIVYRAKQSVGSEDVQPGYRVGLPPAE